MEMIKVTCPGCGRRIKLPDMAGLANAGVECPHCHYKATGAVFLNGAGNIPNEGGIHNGRPYPAPLGVDEKTRLRDERPTELLTQAAGPSLCALRVVATGEMCNLREGSNVIGRHCSTGTADIQIGNDMYMSRRHAQIDVVPRGCAFEYHLVEINSTNIIKLNGQPITRGDVLILSPGDTLTLGTTEVKLEAVDNERTRMFDPITGTWR